MNFPGWAFVSTSSSNPPPGGFSSVWVLLRIAAVSLLLGRGVLYLSGMGPLSALFWNEGLLSEWVSSLWGISWEAYAATSEPLILRTQWVLGGVYLSGAVLCFRYRPGRRWTGVFLVVVAICLAPYWLLRWMDKAYQFPMLLEHLLQWSPPLLLVGYGCWRRSTWMRFCIAVTSLTFAGHGLYALGLRWARPHSFMFMTMKLLPLQERGAEIFLMIHGVLDLVLAGLLVWPRTRIPAAFYMAFWGLVTAFARIASHVTPVEDGYGLHPWLAETIVRFPHGLIPLAIGLEYLYQRRENRARQDPALS